MTDISIFASVLLFFYFTYLIDTLLFDRGIEDNIYQ